MENRKLEILAEELDISEEEIESSGDGRNFHTPQGTYTVLTEDEAYYSAKKQFENGCATFGEVESCVFDDEIEGYISEYYKSCAKDLMTEQEEGYADRLVAECIENGIIDESELTEDGDYNGNKDIAEEFAEYMTDRAVQDYNGMLAGWLKDRFGESETLQILEKNCLIDYDRMTQYSVDNRYETLASFDGNTRLASDFVMFRQSDKDERSAEFLEELEKLEDAER